MSKDYEERLQHLLRDLFQLDLEDLDFGIYRIMGQKQSEIEKFIEEDLIQAVEDEFEKYVEVDKKETKREMEEIKEEIKNTIGSEAITENGEIKEEYQDTPIANKYYEKKETLRESELTKQHKAEIYSKIYHFFNRYYKDGDFIPQMRYGKGNEYAIPYDGEEVKLHWANKDQYYTKTGEYYKNYSFDLSPYRVSFRLIETEQETDNSEDRYFLLRKDNPVVFEEENKELIIYFEHRPVTDEEKDEYGSRYTQKHIKEEMLELIPKKTPNKTLQKKLQKEESSDKTVLENHIDRYTSRNTRDFFIHKDLRGFLEQELDYYLKHEVINLDDIEEERETEISRYMGRIRVIRNISEKIIDFLSQIEEFQKKLWEKKKFVVQADYCITLDKIPEKFYSEILENEDQLEEWKRIYSLEEQKASGLKLFTGNDDINEQFLKENQSMMVDTKFFDEAFKVRLLGAFEDLDKETDGVLVKSENWQALNLLERKFHKRIDGIYIDPPYNTGNDNFIYKDNYQHSTWISFMSDRLQRSKNLMKPDGFMFSSIDDNEYTNLKKLILTVFGKTNYESSFDIKVRHEGRLLRQDIDYQKVNEKALLVAGGSDFSPGRIKEEEKNPYERYKYEVKTLGDPNDIKNIGGYEVEIYNADNVEVKEKEPDKERLKRYTIRGSLITQAGSASEFYEKFLRERRSKDGFGTVYKVIGMGEKGDGLGYRYIKQPEKDGGDNGIYFQGYPVNKTKNKGKPYPTFFDFTQQFNQASNEGGVSLQNGKKPVEFVSKLFEIGDLSKDAFVLDFFAGSGTTAHSVIDMNAEDGGSRKYILVEMGDYFNPKTKKRVQRSIYSNDWDNGVPNSKRNLSHMFKYIQLEQYEDTLNNIEFVVDGEVQKTLKGMDDYLLNYMLDFESSDNATRLDVEELKEPFSYKLKIGGVEEKDKEKIDLVETFNYLLGLHVKKIRNFENDDTKYRIVRGEKDGDNIVVIWRRTKDLDLEKDRDFINKKVLGDLEDTKIYANGQCFVEKSITIDREFKKRMGA